MSANLFRTAPDKKRVAAGDTLFTAGHPAGHFHGVVEGSVELIFDGEVRETVSEGGFFGEVGMLGKRIRSATARAKTEAFVARLDEQAFVRLVKRNPFFALGVMRQMAARLEHRDDNPSAP